MLDLILNGIAVDLTDINNKLMPVLKNNFYHDFDSSQHWVDELIRKVKIGFQNLLPFTE